MTGRHTMPDPADYPGEDPDTLDRIIAGVASGADLDAPGWPDWDDVELAWREDRQEIDRLRALLAEIVGGGR